MPAKGKSTKPAKSAKSSVKAEITALKVMKTPVGVAAFAYLNKPDDSFGKERFRIQVFFPDFKSNPKFKEFGKQIVELQNTFMKEISRPTSKQPTLFKITDEKLSKTVGQPVGTPYLSLESQVNEKNEAGIPVFDASGESAESLVYGGDIVRVEFQLAGWELPQSAGIKGYLRAVQLLKSNWSGGAGNSFEQEDEFLNDENEASDEVADQLEDEEDEEAEETSDEETESSEDADPTQGLI